MLAAVGMLAALQSQHTSISLASLIHVLRNGFLSALEQLKTICISDRWYGPVQQLALLPWNICRHCVRILLLRVSLLLRGRGPIRLLGGCPVRMLGECPIRLLRRGSVRLLRSHHVGWLRGCSVSRQLGIVLLLRLSRVLLLGLV